jgi:hypothetical protein
MFKEEIKFYREILNNNGDITKVNCEGRQCLKCKLSLHNRKDNNWCGTSCTNNIKIAKQELIKIGFGVSKIE